MKNLQAIGVQRTIRRIDPAQYERRVKSFDFDVVTTRYVLRLTPGVEVRTFWGSEAAKTDGSFNLAGMSRPAIDALIGKVHGGQQPRGAEDRHPRARPRAARRPLLGATLVQGRPTTSPTGTSSAGRA